MPQKKLSELVITTKYNKLRRINMAQAHFPTILDYEESCWSHSHRSVLYRVDKREKNGKKTNVSRETWVKMSFFYHKNQ